MIDTHMNFFQKQYGLRDSYITKYHIFKMTTKPFLRRRVNAAGVP